MDKWLAEAEKTERRPSFAELMERQEGWDQLTGRKVV